MRNHIFFLILFLLLPVLYCEAKPIAVFQETIHNFGVVSKDSSMKHTFVFRNTGNSTLVIDRIKAG